MKYTQEQKDFLLDLIFSGYITLSIDGNIIINHLKNGYNSSFDLNNKNSSISYRFIWEKIENKFSFKDSKIEKLFVHTFKFSRFHFFPKSYVIEDLIFKLLLL